MRFSIKFFLIVAMAAFLSVGCESNDDPGGKGGSGAAGGSGGTGGVGGSGGTGGSGGAGGEEGQAKDTSDYEGRLTWSRAGRLGVFLWDLPTSELLHARKVGKLEEDEEFFAYSAPTLSADGTTWAHTVETNFVLTAYQSHVEIVDVESGEMVRYTDAGLGADEIRHTILPSLSRDGRRVAVAEAHAKLSDDGLPEDGTPLSIEIWDRDADVRIRVTDGPSEDTWPILSADGTRVLFLSDRDERKGDFYLADVEENAALQRLSFKSEPSITDLQMARLPGCLAASADLRWVVFRARAEKENEFFLLDTLDGSVVRLDTRPAGNLSDGAIVMRHAIAISADGSTLAFKMQVLDVPEDGDPIIETQVFVAPREDLSKATVVRTSQDVSMVHGLALSADGSQLAFSEGTESLWISRADGSNPKIVATKQDDWVGPDFSGSMYLSF